MPTVIVVAEFIIEVDGSTNEEISDGACDAICRVDCFNSELLSITILDTGKEIDIPDGY